MNDKRIKKAVSLAQRGNVQKAVLLLGKIARKEPDNFDALFYYGTFLAQSGDPDAAVPVLTRATRLDPAAAGAWTNLGTALISTNRAGDAKAAFEKAGSIAPDLPEPLINLAYCCYLLGEHEKARDLANDLVRRGVGDLRPRQTFALASRRLGKVAEAEQAFEDVLAVDPGNMTCLSELANMYASLGRDDEARQYFKRILEISPGHAGATFALRVLNGEELDMVPAEQIRATFDGMAGTFDAHLGQLGYRAPEILAEMADFSGGALRALDLGCGTGQIGQAVRSRCSWLVGVDLSDRMIAEARSKDVYDLLVVDDISSFADQTRGEFDMVFCCDTFVYLGALEKLFKGVAKCLAPRGQFLFSTEPLGDGAYAIQHSGRFAHSRAYIEELAGLNGFEIAACKTGEGRSELDHHIAFDYFRLVKTAA